MKNTVYFFVVLLVFWIAGCTWFYVCKVRMDCNHEATEVAQFPVVETVSITSDSLTSTAGIPLSIPPEYVILFGSGSRSCSITAEILNYFALIKAYAESKSDCTVSVTGYADNSGPDLLNLEISSNRAEFVRLKMVENGIPALIITASGMGEDNPIADNSTPDGRAQNRRVIIKTN